MAVDKTFLMKSIQKKEEMIVAYCAFTNMPFVVCDSESFNDQVWIFDTEAQLQEFAKPYTEKKILLKGIKYPNARFLSFFTMLFTIGINELVFVGENGKETIELDELVRRPDFSKLPKEQQPIMNPELQLTGLYFIYPGSYRLFDVDDLIMNTLGGLAGYALAGPFLKFLPAREDLDRQSYARGESVSLLRRLAAAAFDFVFDALLCSGIAIVAAGAGHSLSTTSIPLLLLAYFILLPGCTGGRTPGMMIASFKIAREDGGRAGFFRLFIRYFLLGAVSVALPLGLCLALFATPVHEQLSALTLLILVGALAAACLFFLLVCMIQAAMHKPLFYEKLSRTRVFSTVKKNK